MGANPPSFTTLNVDDSADAAFRTVTHDTWTPGFDSPWGRITGLAPATITYEYADTSAVTVQTGSGGAWVNVLATGVPLTLIGYGFFSDTVYVGNTWDGVQDILGELTVLNPPSFTTLIIDNCADAGNHTMHEWLDPPPTPGRMAHIDGLAPARINFRAADVSSLTYLYGTGVTTINGWFSFDNNGWDGFVYLWRAPTRIDCGPPHVYNNPF
jgi:hypothetical protein